MITLICGQPRAGKTTYSQQFDDVIHLDTSGAYRGVIHLICDKCDDVVVEGVYHSASLRTELLRTYKGDGSRCIWLNTPLEIRRERLGWDKWCDRPFEPPTYDEGWGEIWVVQNDEKHFLEKGG